MRNYGFMSPAAIIGNDFIALVAAVGKVVTDNSVTVTNNMTPVLVVVATERDLTPDDITSLNTIVTQRTYIDQGVPTNG